MEIRVLGELDVRVGGISVVPSAPKPRQVLALLALRVGEVVPACLLAEELWSGRPPRSARTTVQTYVLQLRELIDRALASGAADGAAERASAKDVLATSPGGYRLNGGGGAADVAEFERLAGLGYCAMDAEDHALAASRLAEALAVWRGPAFADVPTGGQLAVEAKRLEESRLYVLDQRIEADLRLGRHRALIAELTVLVDRYRTHEGLHGQYMIALHRSGRRGEALEAYQRLRTTLVRELGMEPGPGLRRLQRAILLAGPEREPTEPTEPAEPAAPGEAGSRAARLSRVG
ncbi:BTAD domain-containing putative transcriptional regulator [Kitasatospora sp. NPDC051170]|uniref:AfsR/SARP family transcriptional regulator n=1 Tax=Kitasatospora sp. NPDC051170 TaxID=3364056 RepID=UPI00379C448C